jgi:hypothetical protein
VTDVERFFRRLVAAGTGSPNLRRDELNQLRIPVVERATLLQDPLLDGGGQTPIEA